MSELLLQIRSVSEPLLQNVLHNPNSKIEKTASKVEYNPMLVEISWSLDVINKATVVAVNP